MVLLDTFCLTSLVHLIDFFSASISCLCYASLSTIFLCFSSFYSQYNSNFTLIMFQSYSSCIWAEKSLVAFYSSCASCNSSQGSLLVRLNLSCSGCGTRSSSLDSTKGSSADISFYCGTPSIGAFTIEISATFDLARLASTCGHSVTAYFPFRLLSTIVA